MTIRRVDHRCSKPQAAFIKDTARFPAFVGGFGSGKTSALVTSAIVSKLRHPSLNYAYYLPTYDLVKRIAFPRFEEELTRLCIRYRLNISDKVITVWHKGQRGEIIFRTLDKPERIIGYEVADSAVDELDTLPKSKAEDAWNKIIARNRQRKPGGEDNTVRVGTTPEGFRFVYERWVKDAGSMYTIHHASTLSNERNLQPGYIDTLKESYPPQLLDAYLHGKFVNLKSGTVYPSFDRRLNHTDEVDDGKEPLHIGMDFNVYNMAGVVHGYRKGMPVAIDELIGLADTPAMIAAIKDRYPGRDISVYPDSSGGSASSLSASTSDLALLRGAGFRVMCRASNPPVRDRVVSVNAMLLNAKGDRRYKINTDKCPILTASLEQQAYNAAGQPDKSSGDDHPVDAAGYFIHFRHPAQGRPQLGNW